MNCAYLIRKLLVLAVIVLQFKMEGGFSSESRKEASFIKKSIPKIINTDNTEFTQFVVDGTNPAPYKTIQSAVTAAIAAGGPQTILVRPGTYTEDIDFTNGGSLTLLGAVALGDEGQCVINGTHLPPMSGSLVIRNFRLSSSTDIFRSNQPGDAHLTIIDSAISVTNGYTFNLAYWTGVLEMFDINGSLSTNDGVVYNINGASVNIFSAGIGAGNANLMAISGPVHMQAVSIGCPFWSLGNANFYFDDVIFMNPIYCEGNSEGTFRFCTINGGFKSAFTMDSGGNISIFNSIIDSFSEPVIEGKGKGTLTLGDTSFLHNSSFASTVVINFSNTVTGNVILDSLQVREGAKSRIGTSTLMGGIAFVANNNITPNTKIFISRNSTNNSLALGNLLAIKDDRGFTIMSLNHQSLEVEINDYSSVDWLLVESVP